MPEDCEAVFRLGKGSLPVGSSGKTPTGRVGLDIQRQRGAWAWPKVSDLNWKSLACPLLET